MSTRCLRRQRTARRPLGVALASLMAGIVAVGAWPGGPGISAPSSAQAPACAPEDALDEAAAALLLRPSAPDGDSLSVALAEASSDLPGARVLRAPVSDARARARFLAEARQRADAPLVCGEAESETVRVLVVAARAGRLTRDVASGASADEVRVALAPSFRDAYLAGRDADDQLHRWPVDDDVLARGFTVPAGLPRPVLLQLVASGPSGPRPLSRLLVGTAASTSASGATLSVDGDDDLPSRVGALRAHHGVRDLRLNRLLVVEASAHAARVCHSGRVRHQGVEGDAEDPRERLLRRGVQARVVGETVARGRDLQAALRVLSESPSHHMTLVDPRFTDVGYGTVNTAGGTCVVALFAAWPRYVPH
ncbi:MAG: CAP domain-containing protein [Sandaracinaceae bacterium]|nr:CAP domain-containing protein [Sandaracinaceae bacterium]